MPKYFTLTECERLLPEVERALRDALFHKNDYEKADQELNSALQKIRVAGGALLDRGAFLPFVRAATAARPH